LHSCLISWDWIKDWVSETERRICNEALKTFISQTSTTKSIHIVLKRVILLVLRVIRTTTVISKRMQAIHWLIVCKLEIWLILKANQIIYHTHWVISEIIASLNSWGLIIQISFTFFSFSVFLLGMHHKINSRLLLYLRIK